MFDAWERRCEWEQFIGTTAMSVKVQMAKVDMGYARDALYQPDCLNISDQSDWRLPGPRKKIGRKTHGRMCTHSAPDREGKAVRITRVDVETDCLVFANAELC